MKTCTKKMKTGFTLIEMMLVVVVIAVLSLYAVGALQKRAQAALVESTANLISQWLNASLAYYLQNQKWPLSWEDLSPDFLPATAHCTNLITPNDAICGQYGSLSITLSGKDAKTAQYLTISTPVTNNLVGQQIAGKLVGAFYNINTQILQASVVRPGSLTPTQARGYITGAGITQAQDAYFTYQYKGALNTNIAHGVPLPVCSSGLSGHVIFSPMLASSIGADGDDDLGALSLSVSSPIQDKTNNQYYVYPLAYAGRQLAALNAGNTVQWDKDMSVASMKLYPTITASMLPASTITNDNHTKTGKSESPYLYYFITMCLPYDKWIPNPHLPVNSNQTPWGKPMILGEDLQDAHDSNWQNYAAKTATVTYFTQPLETFMSSDPNVKCARAFYPYTLGACSGGNTGFSGYIGN